MMGGMNGWVRVIINIVVLLGRLQLGLLPDLLQEEELLLLNLEVDIVVLNLALDQLLMHHLRRVKVRVESLIELVNCFGFTRLFGLRCQPQLASLIVAAVMAAE